MAFNGGLGTVLFTGLHSIATRRRVSNHASSEADAQRRLGFRLFAFEWPAFCIKIAVWGCSDGEKYQFDTPSA